MARSYKMYLGGEWVDRTNKIKVASPYDGAAVGRVAAASKKDYTEAIKINPRYTLAYYNRGNLCHNKGEYDLAIIDFSSNFKSHLLRKNSILTTKEYQLLVLNLKKTYMRKFRMKHFK